jgi:drug/metabolite transporter (DMT)-like permease
MIFAYLFLDEQLNTLQWLGSCIVMLGLMVHLLGQKINHTSLHVNLSEQHKIIK